MTDLTPDTKALVWDGPSSLRTESQIFAQNLMATAEHFDESVETILSGLAQVRDSLDDTQRIIFDGFSVVSVREAMKTIAKNANDLPPGVYSLAVSTAPKGVTIAKPRKNKQRKRKSR